ncbi:hypothetical protein [Phascolarctobacterium sp.]
MENLFSEGFIQVGRRLFKEHYWEEATPEQKVILLTLLSLAVYEPKVWDAYGRKITLQPGQFVKTLPKLQQECGRGITLSQIKTALHLFAVAGWVTSEPVSRSPKSGKLFTVDAALRTGLSPSELELQRLRRGCGADGIPFKIS